MSFYRNVFEPPVRVERRKTPRRLVMRAGVIILNKGADSIPCTIRNISEAGARLVVDDVQAVPSRFYLSVEGEPGQFLATIRWRKATAIGVSFE